MKNAILLFSIIMALSVTAAKAQVVPDHDTVYILNTAPANYLDNITPLDSDVTLQWRVLSTTFPTDWIDNSGFCDNALCYNNDSLVAENLSPFGLPYTKDSSGVFLLGLDLSSSATLGTYYITVGFNDLYDATATTLFTETFIVQAPALGIKNLQNTGAENISVYPNPVKDALNVSTSDITNVRSIAIYDIYGRLILHQSADRNTSSIDVSNLATGTYFIRVYNLENTVVGTKKIIKM